MNTHPSIPADVVARLTARARQPLADCIGLPKTIRLDAKTTQTGVIVDAAIDRIRLCSGGRAAEVVYRIVMECGAAKARREFFVCQLPR